ncbi:MAG TPA: YncE family protein [Dehalococcoidia bacterium]|nr:YncE family protein [Dehalococcoidia bacterium]
METNRTGYWQTLTTVRVNRRRAMVGIGTLFGGAAALALVGCGANHSPAKTKAPAGPPRGELVKLNDSSPHVAVYDPETRQLKRSADIPNFLRWSWNDDNNYFDGKNLWLGGMTPLHKEPDFNGNEVILLDLDTLTATKRISVGKEGTIVNTNTGVSNAMLNTGKSTPDGHVFVGKMWAGEVASIDVKTQAVVMTKRVVDGEDWVCDSDVGVSSDGLARLFVVTNNTGKLLSIDPKTLAVQSSYQSPAGVRPYMITVSPDGSRLWVENTFAPGYEGEHLGLTIFEAKSLNVVKQIDTGKTPVFNTFSPDGKLSYVGHGDGSYISVFDTATSLAEVKRIEVGANASSLATHPDGKSIFVRVSGSDNYVVPVETGTWQVGERFGGVGPAPLQSGLYMRRLS